MHSTEFAAPVSDRGRQPQSDPFAKLPFGLYRVILADPPWHWKSWSAKGEGRSAANHYKLMSLKDIQALPVASLGATDCALFLWAIYPMLPQALETMAKWGFKYKTVAFTWAKTGRRGLPEWHMGLGYWTRANAEICLLGTRGKPTRISRSIRQLVVASAREHSRKPDQVRDRIVQLMGDVPRIELFARMREPGWDAWGDDL